MTSDYGHCISVPEPPLNVIVQPRYSYLTGDTVGFMVDFTDLVTMQLIIYNSMQ